MCGKGFIGKIHMLPVNSFYFTLKFHNFQLHGMLRVVMKPLITNMPLVGGLQVFFLNNPDIDFDLLGIADVLDMPGLR